MLYSDYQRWARGWSSTDVEGAVNANCAVQAEVVALQEGGCVCV